MQNSDMNIGTIHTTNNCGDLVIIDYINAKKVKVRFMLTGYEKTVSAGNIREGKVKDVLCPSVYGVGFLGCGDHKVSINKRHTKKYITWRDMIERCYTERMHLIRPTYIGVSVCDDWHNFQNFGDWYDKHYIEGYHLDKDKKSGLSKVYSPNTCCFISVQENIEIAKAKHITLIAPDGEVHEIFNLAKWCRDNGYSTVFRRGLNKVANGFWGSYRGWKIC